MSAYVRHDVALCTAVAVIAARKGTSLFPSSKLQRAGSSDLFTCTLKAWDRWRRVRSVHGLDLPSPSQALCSRITLNGATQPKPNLWSLTLTSLLWLGWPTLTPVLTPSKPLCESVIILGCRSRVDQCRWLLETICPALGPRRLRALRCSLHSLLCLSASWEGKDIWAVGSAELTAQSVRGSP